MSPMTAEELLPYRLAVHERICTMCNDLGAHGACARPPDEPCALITHLEPIVEAILAVGGSADVDPYDAALRAAVCPTCRQDEDGRCALRDVSQCAPNAYLLPLIEVVEEVAEAQRSRGAA